MPRRGAPRNDVKGDVRNDVKGDVRNDVKGDVRNDVEGDVRNDKKECPAAWILQIRAGLLTLQGVCIAEGISRNKAMHMKKKRNINTANTPRYL